jgi:pre-mRNA-processing factor 19
MERRVCAVAGILFLRARRLALCAVAAKRPLRTFFHFMTTQAVQAAITTSTVLQCVLFVCLCSCTGSLCGTPLPFFHFDTSFFFPQRSGHVFEKRLIEKHLSAGQTCPVTNEPLTMEDLIAMKINPIVRPRPANITSFPSMLQAMQSEWDAVMLETYSLKQHLNTVKQELAHALYQHDAACRVIARLLKERDDARAALADSHANISKVVAASGHGQPAPVSGSAAVAMEDDNKGGDTGISEAVVQNMVNTHKNLSKTRKQVLKDRQAQVAARDKVEGYSMKASHPLHSSSTPGVLALDIHPANQDLVLTGGADSTAILFNKESGKVETERAWAGN